jgi:hypothetical protein
MLVAVGLVAGGVQGPAVRLATGAGTPTDGKLQVLLTVPDLEQRRVLVRRSAVSTTTAPVVMMGRRPGSSSLICQARS